MVWVGSRSTMRSLNDAQPAMLNAAARLPGLTLKVICDVFPDLAGVRVLPVRWSSETEAARDRRGRHRHCLASRIIPGAWANAG